jgi:ribosomal protein L34E
MDLVSYEKKTPTVIRCSDCNDLITANTNKEELLKNNGIETYSINRIISECSHPLCSLCITKTIKNPCIKNGVCDQCMWWAIT